MGISDNEVLSALDTIKVAKDRLHLSIAGSATRSALISKIRLCNILLRELRTIDRNLERNMGSPGPMHRSPLLLRSRFGNRYLATPRGSPANHSQVQSQVQSMRAEPK